MPRHPHPGLAVVGNGERVNGFGLVLTTRARPDDFLRLVGERQRLAAVVRGRAQFRVLIGVIQVDGFTIDGNLDQGRIKVVRQREREGNIGDAGDGRQFRGQHKLRLKTGCGQHGVQQNGPVRPVPVTVGQGGVSGGKFAQGQFGEGRPGFANGLGHKIADGLDRIQFRLA